VPNPAAGPIARQRNLKYITPVLIWLRRLSVRWRNLLVQVFTAYYCLYGSHHYTCYSRFCNIPFDFSNVDYRDVRRQRNEIRIKNMTVLS